MDKELLEEAKQLAKSYSHVTLSEDKTSSGEPLYLYKDVALDGCMAQGKSLEEALANLEDARVDYIYALLQDGLEIPAPVSTISGFTEDTIVAEVNIKDFVFETSVSWKRAFDQVIQPDNRQQHAEALIKT